MREFNNVITDLHNALAGLKNLKKTYDNDVKFKCDIDILLEKIQTTLEKEKANITKKNH